MFLPLAILVLVPITLVQGAALPTGLLPQNIEGRIVGGSATTINAHPWQVSLQRWGSHSCGGAIYSNTIIVTAAHCLPNTVTPSVLRVRAGSSYHFYLGTLSDVAAFKIHPQYSTSTKMYDIAILRLKTPLNLSGSTMKSIALADATPANGASATCSGWGTTSYGGPYASKLLYINTHIVSRSECAGSRYGYASKIKDTMICAAETNKDACQGDSGGPLVSNNKLVGLVSWGTGCAQTKYPGVYTDVAQLKSWVVDEAKKL
ncbi:trypsin delta/gamma-like protein CG30031 [Scaptodrosophila lebanonensis]|uniref:trypsin n=1 Tax=Drosophila lebanonensis TaxID=7225 RepID=A0A6J2UH02_DROLE|nr:trypsin delta/gamma-like protein CG30031 [Scaptodrosophila lebanonensis]